MDSIMPPFVPADRKTRVAVRGTYLHQALEALRRAIPLEDDDDWRGRLTEAAAVVAYAERHAGRQYAQIREDAANDATIAPETETAPEEKP
jgi:hypothetical protein